MKVSPPTHESVRRAARPSVRLSIPRSMWLLIALGFAICQSAAFAQDDSTSASSGANQDAVNAMLQKRVAALRAQVRSMDLQIASLDNRIPTLVETVDKLLQELDELKAPKPEEEEEKPKPKPREEKYRPPFLTEEKSKSTPIAVVCQNGRAAILDIDLYNREVKKMLDNRAALLAFVEAKRKTFDAGDFEFVWTLEQQGADLTINQEIKPKANRPGESLGSIARSNSQLRRKLSNMAPNSAVIQFVVYPDSFDVFRSARQLVWNRKLAVNWIPLVHGEPFGIGAGNPSSQ